MQCVAVFVLQCVGVCCSVCVSSNVAVEMSPVCCSVLQSIAASCSVLQCVAVYAPPQISAVVRAKMGSRVCCSVYLVGL